MMKSDFTPLFLHHSFKIWVEMPIKWPLFVCDCYEPSASQVTRMVSWSPHCAGLCYWGGVALDHSRHHRFVTQRADTGCGVSLGAGQGPPGRLQPSQMVNRSAQTHNIIMGSRHTSKDSVHHLFSFSSSFVYSHLKNSRFFENFPTHLWFQTRLWLSFTTKKPWNKGNQARLEMAIVHCKTEIIDFAAIQN